MFDTISSYKTDNHLPIPHCPCSGFLWPSSRGIIIADNAALPTTTWLVLAGVALSLSFLIFIIGRIRVSRSFGGESLSARVSLAPVILLEIALGGI